MVRDTSLTYNFSTNYSRIGLHLGSLPNLIGWPKILIQKNIYSLGLTIYLGGHDLWKYNFELNSLNNSVQTHPKNLDFQSRTMLCETPEYGTMFFMISLATPQSRDVGRNAFENQLHK